MEVEDDNWNPDENLNDTILNKVIVDFSSASFYKQNFFIFLIF